MRLSFIVPVYNCKCYLNYCVQNIISARLNDYEIIIVDDGSTDGSELICDYLKKQYSNIKCIHQSINKGVSYARNKGLMQATGDYIFFLDADDEIDVNELRSLIYKIEADNEIDMAIFGLSFDYYYKGAIYRRDELKTPLAGIFEKNIWRKYIIQLFEANALSPIWNKIIRRDLLIQENLMLRTDMILYEDLEYSLRCLNYSNKVLFEPSIIYHYRQSEDEGNAGRRLKKISNLTDVVHQIENAFAIDIVLEDKAKILLFLYVTLAREKISVSKASEIRSICKNFKEWYLVRDYHEQNRMIKLLLKCRVLELIFRRNYTAVRHCLAVKIKNTSWYQKWKG